MLNFFQWLKDVVFSLWPYVNQQARDDARAKGDAAAAQVKTLDDVQRDTESRQ